jgi:hypothetical protein
MYKNNNPLNAQPELFTARLGMYRTFSDYLSSYEYCVNEIYESMVGEGRPTSMDVVANPVLFMMRHSLEIGLKLNIKYLTKYSGKKDFIKIILSSHEIGKLWNCFKIHFNAIIKSSSISVKTKQQSINIFNNTEKFINLIESIDNEATAFRYPINTSGKIIFERNLTINLLEYKNLYDDTMKLLKYSIDVLIDEGAIAIDENEFYDQSL